MWKSTLYSSARNLYTKAGNLYMKTGNLYIKTGNFSWKLVIFYMKTGNLYFKLIIYTLKRIAATVSGGRNGTSVWAFARLYTNFASLWKLMD